MKKRGEAGEGEGCASERGIKVFKGKRGGTSWLRNDNQRTKTDSMRAKISTARLSDKGTSASVLGCRIQSNSS
jgi:hypothetical protein